MVTRDKLIEEIDTLPNSYLDGLYRIVQAIKLTVEPAEQKAVQDWPTFVREIGKPPENGLLERQPQGNFEQRLPMQ